MKVVIIIAALLSLAVAYSDLEYQNAFSKWMHDNQKSYTNDEFQSRYSVFKSNMDYVSAWNTAGSATVLGLTPFADLTNAEYKSIYLGMNVDATQRLANAAPFTSTGPLADTINWVTKGAVTGIKNQGQCGSCWSFSTTGSSEGAHFLSTGNLVSLSEQNLMDCSHAYGNNGCNGGDMDASFQYIIANGGIDTEASYPYLTETTYDCRYTVANRGATLMGYTDVASGSESALQSASNGRPVSVAIDASHNSFQLYTSGVYYEPACSTTQLDHGVLVVGYGTDTTTGSDYWIVKNSWGTTWGMSGYIWMSRNRSNNCGIATMASWPSA
jgi:cathepsin L